MMVATSVSSATESASKLQTNDLLKSYLKLTSFRHKVLSANIANLNTPGYKANEVSMPQKYNDLTQQDLTRGKLKLRITSKRHLTGISGAQSANFATEKLKDPEEEKLNGNNVSLSQQMTKISQNQIYYDTALRAYVSNNSLIAAALGK